MVYIKKKIQTLLLSTSGFLDCWYIWVSLFLFAYLCFTSHHLNCDGKSITSIITNLVLQLIFVFLAKRSIVIHIFIINKYHNLTHFPLPCRQERSLELMIGEGVTGLLLSSPFCLQERNSKPTTREGVTGLRLSSSHPHSHSNPKLPLVQNQRRDAIEGRELEVQVTCQRP